MKANTGNYKYFNLSWVHEGTPNSNRKRHHYNAAVKLEAINYAREKRSAKSGNKFNVASAAKKYKVTKSRIYEWIGQETKLKQQVNTPGGSKRKKLDGGGRHVTFPKLDAELADWIRQKRENKQPVSRPIISTQAAEIFRGKDLKISVGWLTSFLCRNNFVLRRRTTTAQKPPENYAETVAKFVMHIAELRKKNRFSQLIAMDETAVWFDCPDGTCIETKGSKDDRPREDASDGMSGCEKLRNKATAVCAGQPKASHAQD
uniref:HTH CENPB-type domain-containing protein n=1 Tax=Ditylenchus dipsaci TaxID=166011 RepID=A0A915EC86_9BILA